jgi:hypothetical protein
LLGGLSRCTSDQESIVSDWQAAKMLLSDRWMAILVEENLVTPEKQKEMASHLYSRSAECLLKTLILTQEANAAACPKLEEVVQKWDIINQARKTVKGYTVTEVE